MSGFSEATFGQGKMDSTWSRGNGVLLEDIMCFVTRITRVLTSLAVRQQCLLIFFKIIEIGICGILHIGLMF